MPVLFACPHCRCETVVDEVYIGQSGPCAMCGRIITVPGQTTMFKAVAQKASRQGLTGQSIFTLVAVIAGSLLAGVAAIGFAVAIIAPAVTTARYASQRAKSASNLQLISQALQQYHDQYGAYPPAFTTDKTGKRMHSWRVLILPQLGHKYLYDQYDLNQTWDSPNNARLVSQMPQVYAAPGDESALASFETSYVVIVGRKTVFTGANQSLSQSKIVDGLPNTLLVAESAESGICWMEPKDLDAATMNFTVNGATTNCIRSTQPAGATALFADGRAHFLTADLPPQYIEALTTASSGDEAPIEALANP